jgi:hydrogenase expression/formation protein HypC
MCLGIPGKIIEITDVTARVDVTGTKKEVNLMLMDNVMVGDYVIIHAGFAIQKVNEREARETLQIITDLIGEKG